MYRTIWSIIKDKSEIDPSKHSTLIKMERVLELGNRQEGIYGYMTLFEIGTVCQALRLSNPQVIRYLAERRETRERVIRDALHTVRQQYRLPKYQEREWTIPSLMRYLDSLTGKAKRRHVPALSMLVFMIVQKRVVSSLFLQHCIRQDLFIKVQEKILQKLTKSVEDILDVSSLFDHDTIEEKLCEALNNHANIGNILKTIPSDFLGGFLIRYLTNIYSTIVYFPIVALQERLPLSALLEALPRIDDKTQRSDVVRNMVLLNYLDFENVHDMFGLLIENTSTVLWSEVYTRFLDVSIVRERFFQSFFEDIGNLSNTIRVILKRILGNYYSMTGTESILQFLVSNMPVGYRPEMYTEFWDLLQPSVQNILEIDDSTFRDVLLRRRLQRDGASIENFSIKDPNAVKSFGII